MSKLYDITIAVKMLLGDNVEYAYSESDAVIDDLDGSIDITDRSDIIIKIKDRDPVILWVSEWGGIRPKRENEGVLWRTKHI